LKAGIITAEVENAESQANTPSAQNTYLCPKATFENTQELFMAW